MFSGRLRGKKPKRKKDQRKTTVLTKIPTDATGINTIKPGGGKTPKRWRGGRKVEKEI